MRRIKDYENYAVTSCGKVWSYKSKKFLKPRYNKWGYASVVLYDTSGHEKSFFIHRLVAQAYIPNPDNLPEVNHKDEVKDNNCIGNLEWCTKEYNNNYGTRIERIVEKHKKKVYCIEKDMIFDSIKEAGEYFGIHPDSITNHLHGRSKTAGRCHWKLLEECAAS